MNFLKLQTDLTTIANELITAAKLQKGDIFVLGCSTSEIMGQHIGKASDPDVGQTIIQCLKDILDKKQLYLAVQGCEHINRALVVERKFAQKKELELVAVKPALHAGGACSVAAFKLFEDPVEVEHITAQAGLDIGDTAIGMHIKHVQVPFRPSIKELGGAHVTALRSRPKYIGGPRAQYE
ncbi:MAG TPA: TIGR01440 family protein [Tetragenococcus sp.]|nr:TIGR01440 family protein [Tetragenococcus sp.]